LLTNFELFDRVCSEAIDELLSNMPSVPESGLVLLDKARGIGEADFVFENVLLKRMRSAGFRVATEVAVGADSTASPPEYRFSYQIIRLSLEYPKISRRYWLGAKEVQRSAEIGLFVQLVDLGSSDTIWVGDTEKNYNDVIAYSLLGTVESEQYGFTKPPRNELRWRKLLEPIVVTGIVTGLVFLFFSNQSDE
ncbi:MAG: hypothetical protein KAX38_03970, partial [Candidatus Krumholzibacteria bacterium]|nr:hypothetical protein [Candidatus Krumholzibacteria bacterium]